MASMFDPMRYSGPASLGRRRKGRCCREKQEQEPLLRCSFSARSHGLLHLPVKCIEYVSVHLHCR